MSPITSAIPVNGKTSFRSFHSPEIVAALSGADFSPLYFSASLYYHFCDRSDPRRLELKIGRYKEAVKRKGRFQGKSTGCGRI